MKAQNLLIWAVAALTIAFVGSAFWGTDIRADASRLIEAVAAGAAASGR